jgi:hypothetical protein
MHFLQSSESRRSKSFLDIGLLKEMFVGYILLSKNALHMTFKFIEMTESDNRTGFCRIESKSRMSSGLFPAFLVHGCTMTKRIKEEDQGLVEARGIRDHESPSSQ